MKNHKITVQQAAEILQMDVQSLRVGIQKNAFPLRSKIDRCGIENILFCVGDCKIDNRGICNGEYICFENNHKTQRVNIYSGNYSSMGLKMLERIKDEVWELRECVNWLNSHGYKVNRGCEQ